MQTGGQAMFSRSGEQDTEIVALGTTHTTMVIVREYLCPMQASKKSVSKDPLTKDELNSYIDANRTSRQTITLCGAS
jgi:hypothetical protein